MGKALAIDYGTKRTGIAVTDDLQIIASGLTTVNSKELIPFLKEYVSKNKVITFVIGEPKRLNNEPAQSHEAVEAAVKDLQKHFPEIEGTSSQYI